MKFYVKSDNQDKESFPGIREALVRAQALSAKRVEIEVFPGIYRLREPLVIRREMGFDSVRIFGRDREHTVLCGSLELKLKWERYRGGIFCAQTEKNLDLDMLYVNGIQYHMARYPKYDESVRIMQGYAPDCLSPERTAGWSNPEGGYFHVLHNHRWGDFHYRMTGKDAQGNVLLEGGTQNNRRTGIHETYRYVENIFEELTAEGEWFYERTKGMLYVFFRKEDAPESALVEAVVNEALIRVEGEAEDLQKEVKLESLTFRHTHRTFMKVKEPLLRSDWCIYRGGALFFENTEDCTVKDCRLIDLGSNALCVNGKNRGFSIEASLIREIGGNGICFVGRTECVRNPLFEYGERLDFEELDPEPGPKTEEYPRDCQVADCLITRTGRVEKQTAAVQVSMSRGIRIAHCSIYEVPRAAVNVSEGCFGGHILEDCDIFDAVLETGDHGGFNSWGRDRYWELKGVDLNRLKELQLEQLPFLDAVDTNTIRNNRVRCDWGWDLDLDDGSSNYEIYNNLCLNGGIKLREGFGRRVYNNITVNNSMNVHAWYAGSGDYMYHNILFGKYRPIRMEVEWGDQVDDNVVHSGAESAEPRPALLLQRDSHKDAHSFLCSCMFRDPENGDYTVQNERVLQSGFCNFDMKHFGVVSGWLRRIAKTPEFPAIQPLLDISGAGAVYAHGRAVFKNIESLEEASAYGAGSCDGIHADGVIVCELPPFLELSARGLKAGDIILGMNGTKIRSIEDLKECAQMLDQPVQVKFQILRGQEEMSL